MGDVKKKVSKPFKSIGGSIGDFVGKVWDVNKKVFVDPFKSAFGALTPEMPNMPDAPLVPDLERIERDRSRRRTGKMGRVETIMTSDTLG